MSEDPNDFELDRQEFVWCGIRLTRFVAPHDFEVDGIQYHRTPGNGEIDWNVSHHQAMFLLKPEG